MTNRENYLRTVHFEKPDFIPVSFWINPSCWDSYDHDALFELMETHPLLFPDFKKPEGEFHPEYSPVTRKDDPFLDDLDGAREYQTVFHIVIPMIAPTIAAVSMFFALGFWNSWFSVMVYTDNSDMWTLQYFLRGIISGAVKE
ncbi:hypothetical protein FACS1894147_01440 [Spirochaetia bacterium]|nr:hypothetical protein FACS1894147_01440 [Spirochaetia bacterium]